jgi:hypothetical protein
MNKLVATLATTTVLFAVSTIYFWQKSAVSAPAGVATAAAATPAGGATVASTGASPTNRDPDSPSPRAGGAILQPATGAAASTSAAARPGRTDPSREVMLPFAKDWLRQYDDPAQRASLTKAARTGIEAQYARLRDRLKLDASTFDQLVDLLAQEQLEQQSNYFHCLVDPSCDTSAMRPPRDHSDEYQAMLGPDAFAQFNAYRQAMPEWQAVVQLRGRLGESNYLRDADADRLLGALSAERERYVSESNQAGTKLRGWGTGNGMVWYAGDGGADEQLASAQQYSERMRQRAAAILNAEQLRAFTQLQDELLANFANYLRSQSGRG